MPIALATIVAATAIPIELRGPVWWDARLSFPDIVANLLLYVPFGLAFRRQSLRAALVVAVLLSTTIEISQIWSIGRHASLIDLATNATGAVLGRTIGRWSGREVATIASGSFVSYPWLLAAVLGVAVVVTAWSIPPRPSDLSTWKPGYSLLLGNEVTLNRPWKGTIRGASISPVAHHSPGASATGAPTGGRIDVNSPVSLGDGPGFLIPHAVSRQFAEMAMRHNAFSIRAQIESADLAQQGPARIVSFSADPFHRNFDLGQQGRTLVFRVRTAVTGENGERGRTETSPILEAGRVISVVGSYDGSVARIFVDGRLYGRSNLAAAGCAVPALCDSDVPMTWATLGGFIALIILAVFPWQRRCGALTVGLVAGALALVLPRILQIGEVPIRTQPWSQLMAVFGAGAVAFAASRLSSMSQRT